MFKRKKKKAKNVKYVIVAENGNYLGYVSFRVHNDKFHIDTLWFVGIDNALKFDSLAMANCLINEKQLKGTHIEEVEVV